MRLKALNFDNFDNSHNSFLWQEYFIDFLCERCMDPMSDFDIRLCLHYRPETVHCSTKDAYSSEITFVNCNLESTGTQSSAIRGREGTPHLYFVQPQKLSQNQLLSSALTIFFRPHIFSSGIFSSFYNFL